ncbi:hypothetical protein BH11ARM1_BH11ARM1_05950 [soil metagenome]
MLIVVLALPTLVSASLQVVDAFKNHFSQYSLTIAGINLGFLGLAYFLWVVPETFAGRDADREVTFSPDSLKLLHQLLIAIGAYFGVGGLSFGVYVVGTMLDASQSHSQFSSPRGLAYYAVQLISGVALVLIGRKMMLDAGNRRVEVRED